MAREDTAGRHRASSLELVDVLPDAMLTLTPAISSRAELFDAYQRGLRFPDYFGKNWDALHDCLGDLSWLDVEEVCVVHDGLPSLPAVERRVYLEVLADVLTSRKSSDRPRLRVVFSEAERSQIAALLSSTGPATR